jgi:hypothetical protein
MIVGSLQERLVRLFNPPAERESENEMASHIVKALFFRG